MILRILHTNDLHGHLSAEKALVLAEARVSCDLYFDSGDAIKAGNLGLPLRQEEVWSKFDQLELTAFCPGNRESHVLAPAVEAKLKGCNAPMLCANWHDRVGNIVFKESIQLDVKGVRVGVLGVMVPMVTKRMKTQALSAYLWSSPIEAAQRVCRELRPKVDLLICLSHIGLGQDRRLAEACPELDLIFGGHSHDVLDPPELVSDVPILQAGSHGRFYGVTEWSTDRGLISSHLTAWPKSGQAPAALTNL